MRRRTTGPKFEVSEYALIRRVNRLLKTMPLKDHEACQLFKTRDRDAEKRQKMGIFYIVADDEIVRTHIDLEKFARERGALAPYEILST